MIKLHDLTLSGHCHKVRLFLSLIGVEYEPVAVDLLGGEHRRTPFLTLNPFGKVPVLDDDGFIVRDSNAILVYLARKYGSTDWLPEDAEGLARVQEWLAVSTHDILTGPCYARLVTVFGFKLDHQAAVGRSHDLLTIMERHLDGRDWLALDRPTIADIACFTYIAHAPEGGVTLQPYPSIRTWLANVEALPGFVPMPAQPATV